MERLLFLLLIGGCSAKAAPVPPTWQPYYEQEKDPRKSSGVDFHFQEYVEHFEKDCERSIGDIPIGFEEIEAAWEAAYCLVTGGRDRDWPEIRVDIIWWNEVASDSDKRWLIYHELGHCLLNRDHDSRVRSSSGLPMSIMIPTIPFGTAGLWAEYEDYYVNELCFEPAVGDY